MKEVLSSRLQIYQKYQKDQILHNLGLKDVEQRALLFAHSQGSLITLLTGFCVCYFFPKPFHIFHNFTEGLYGIEKLSGIKTVMISGALLGSNIDFFFVFL